MAGTQIKTPNYSLESVALFKGVPAETLGRIQATLSLPSL